MRRFGIHSPRATRQSPSPPRPRESASDDDARLATQATQAFNELIGVLVDIGEDGLEL